MVIGTEVFLRDRPLGKPLHIRGKIVGSLPNGIYRVLMQNGWNKGKTIEHKYWDLFFVDSDEKML